MKKIQTDLLQVSRDVLRVGQGSLYPALHRLEARDWISFEWGHRRITAGRSSTN